MSNTIDYENINQELKKGLKIAKKIKHFGWKIDKPKYPSRDVYTYGLYKPRINITTYPILVITWWWKQAVLFIRKIIKRLLQ